MNYFPLFQIQKFKKNFLKSSLVIGGAMLLAGNANAQINLIYTSDSHYGIARSVFQGATTVNAQKVNQEMIAKLNGMSLVTFPSDNGVKSAQVVGPIDYVINTGDIANRQETGDPLKTPPVANIQSAAASWAQFKIDYIDGITLKNRSNQKTNFLLLPGNHDVSNTIGYYKAMTPAYDSTSYLNIYNSMMPTPVVSKNFDYKVNKVNYSKNIGGVHFMFVTLWPDSANRKWMDLDLVNVSSKTPVVIFTHDQPDIETKHLFNPNVPSTINSSNKFENMVEEKCKDGLLTTAPSTLEQRGFALWVKAHPNVKAYFHGNTNYNQFYVYTGPDKNIALRTFRVDSPLKGESTNPAYSGADEKKLSYQVISLDSVSRNMTVRECLWNPTATNGAPVQWGASITLALNKGDSLLNVAKTLTESNYSIPSWTLLKRYANLATKLRTDSSATAFSLRDSSITVALQNALNGLKAKEIPYSVNMTFNGSPSTQMGFAWYTNKGIDKGKVQIVLGKTSDNAAFAMPLTTFNADTTNITTNYCVKTNGLLALAGIADNSVRSYSSHKALAAGLTPNTTYSYRVGIDGGWSEIGSFSTAKSTKEPFSFMYFTDSQANTDEMFAVSAKTTHAAKALFPNSNFALSCGDLVETAGSPNAEWEYEQFFQTQQDIWNTTPLVAVIGNHDNTSNKNFSKHFNTSSPNFDKTMSTVTGSIYSFVYGDALFMAVQHEDYAKTGMMDSIKTWMQKQVAANPTVKWRIAFFHKTMYTGSASHQSDPDGKAIREFFTPVFDDLKIDLALEGHDHVYEVIGPLKAKALVPNTVSNQTTSTPIYNVAVTNNNANVTGKNGGTFDVKTGTMYFLNNSAGEKKYRPRIQSEMDSAKVVTATGITGYFNFFSGKFGQTGEPTFSNVKVSTDSICIATYTVNKTTNVATLYDSIKLIKATPNAVNSVYSDDASVIVSPIPARIEIAVSGLESVDKMELFDLGGKKVVSVVNDKKMSVASLQNGVYLLKINSNEKQLIRKVTINK
ncbi:MAG: metallophosphoesterase [Paludibacter sp.]